MESFARSALGMLAMSSKEPAPPSNIHFRTWVSMHGRGVHTKEVVIVVNLCVPWQQLQEEIEEKKSRIYSKCLWQKLNMFQIQVGCTCVQRVTTGSTWSKGKKQKNRDNGRVDVHSTNARKKENGNRRESESFFSLFCFPLLFLSSAPPAHIVHYD